MHATKQPYISAKLFRKRLLQYCWKGKKEKASVHESIFRQARLRSTVTEERMLSLITGCSVVEGTLSGYFVLKAQNPLYQGWALLKAAELPLSSAKPGDRSEKELRPVQTALGVLCLTSSKSQVSLICNLYFQVLYYAVWAPFLKNFEECFSNHGIILQVWPWSDLTMSLFQVLQLILGSRKKALKKSLNYTD